jgi:murein DD-endopeptidase MepM/ murein hydrolase activator NlpD
VAVKTTVGFARRGLDPARLAGNHVIMATGGTYALYAHLAPGSVAVTSGQQVRVGEVLGRVGHSG